MITERTLTKWRKEALYWIQEKHIWKEGDVIGADLATELHERILRLTQELLDQHLIRKISR